MTKIFGHVGPALFLILFVASISNGAAAVVQNPPIEELTDQQIERLIDQLSDPKFAVRESATSRLIAAGPQAIPRLRKAIESSSIEVQVRAKTILAHRPAKLETDISDSDQALINQFRTIAPKGRLLMLRTHATSNKPKLFLRLVEIELVDAQQEKRVPMIETYMLTNPAVFSNLLSSAIARNHWDGVKHVIDHPVTQRYSPMIRAHLARRRGQFQQYIDKTFDEIRLLHETMADIVDQDLISLIGLLRLQRDFKRAEEAIAWLPDRAIQDSIRQKIAFQKGDWNEILRRAKLKPGDSGRIPANAMQMAMLQYLAGDKAGVSATISQLRKKIADARLAPPGEGEGKDKDVESALVQKLQGDLRLIGIITLDWRLTEEFLNQNDVEENIKFLSALNRVDQALELMEFGNRFEDRLARMKQVLKELGEAQNGVLKLGSRRRGAEYAKLKATESKLTTMAFLIAESLGNRGLDDEAKLYYQMIFTADKSSGRTNQQKALANLLELGDQKHYWRLSEAAILGPDKQKFAGRVNFGIGNSLANQTATSLARQWSAGIRGSFEDPLLEAKTIAAVVNSPWVDKDAIDFDLDYEIARYRSGSRLTADGNVEFNLAQVMEFHGDDETAGQLLQQSSELGNSKANALRFQRAVAANDYRTILDSWLGSYRGYRSASGGLIAENAAKKMLESSELTEDEKADVERHLDQAQIATMSIWHGNSHWITSGMVELSRLESEHLSIFPLQAIVYGVNGEYRTAQQMQSALELALASKKSDQKMQGGIESATSLFDSLAFDSANAKPNDVWLRSSLNLHYALARGLIHRGEHEKAADLMVRVAQFSLGDVTAGEDAIGLLSEAGAMEDADRVYEAIASYYRDQLKKYPDSPLARNNYAWLSACANRDLESAYRHAKLAVEVRPNTVQYLDTLAEVEFLMGNADKAYELSKRCVQLYPSRFYYRQQKNRFLNAKNQ
jgi:tetratricopeptide (TPR) repeat protein